MRHTSHQAREKHSTTPLALRLAAFAMLFCLCAATPAQSNERRFCYLDITGSMEKNGIWEPVKEKLKEAIRKTDDETTILEVVAWTDERHTPLQRMERKATVAGKRELCGFIDNLKTENDCHTDVHVPFDDFYSKTPGCKGETYFFLMTDGTTFSKNRPKLDKAINDWSARTNNHTYGFYVMQTGEAAANDIKTAVERQNSQLWTVETADFNIGQVKLEKTDYMVRDRKGYFDIHIVGNVGKGSIKVTTADEHYAIKRQEKTTDARGNAVLRVHVEPRSSQLPEMGTIRLSAEAQGLPAFTFLMTKFVEVECVNIPMPAVEISFR